MTEDNLQSLWLTLKLASVTTALLLIVGIPFSYWLSRSRSRLKVIGESLVAMPLVLPPTVIGYYLLIAMSPQYAAGRFLQDELGISLAFSFWGLVVGSFVYSLPFVVQPIQAAFESFDPRMLEATAVGGASPWMNFIKITAPHCSSGLVTALVLGFAHTVGEFGVVLMIGGNIPGQTKVVSIAIFDHVESMNYAAANELALYLIGFSFLTLLLLYGSKLFTRTAQDRTTRLQTKRGFR